MIHISHVIVTLFEPREHQAASLPRGRTLHTLTAVSDDTLFLFGGLSTSGEVLSMFMSRFRNYSMEEFLGAEIVV